MLTKPRGPILGAKDDVAPTSPPMHLKLTAKYTKYGENYHRYYHIHSSELLSLLPTLISLGSNLGGILLGFYNTILQK